VNKDNFLISKQKTAAPPPPRRARSIRLRTAFDVNRLLAKTINGLLRNEILEGKAGKIGFLCGVMLKAFEVSQIEQRLADLERRTAEQEESQP
jgi:hypothetical protein